MTAPESRTAALPGKVNAAARSNDWTLVYHTIPEPVRRVLARVLGDIAAEIERRSTVAR